MKMETTKSVRTIPPKGAATSSPVPSLETDLELQHKYVERLKEGGEQSFALIAADAFVRGMRDSGYKSTATAIDELVDNAIQAQATRVDVLYTVENLQGNLHEISNIAVIDDGHGMEPDMIRAAVLWGGTHRENDRTGFGRYGFGLPSAAVSLTEHFEVYSRVKGDKWYRVAVDLKEVCSGKLTNDDGLVLAPEAEVAELPSFVSQYLGKRTLEQGTVILLVAPDRLRSGFRKPNAFHSSMMEHLGLIYRGLLNRCVLYVNGKKAEPVDPLFLDPGARFYDVGNSLLAEGRDRLQFEVKTRDGKVGSVRMRFSYMPDGFQGYKPDLNERFPIMKANHSYFIVTRSGRQIDLVTRPRYEKESHNITLVYYDMNWAVELDFDPVLDEEFGITVNKQQVVLSDRMWKMLEDQGVPQIIGKDLKARVSREKKENEAPDSTEQQKTSEAVMSEAEKFQAKPVEIPVAKEEQARERVLQEAEKQAQQTKRPKEEVVKEILTEINAKPYEVRYEGLEGAPFYRMEQYGPQQRLYINTRHRFYTDLYTGPDATPRLKAALELLLFAVGCCELESSGDRETFYRNERGEWSRRLDVRLELLDRHDSVQDADEAKLEQTELAAKA